MTEEQIEYTDQSAAMVLMAVAQMLEAEGKWPRAQALRYAAARLLSFPSWHPSMSVSDGIEIGAWESEHHRAFMRVVDDIMGGGK
jgi:hypothetical protein